MKTSVPSKRRKARRGGHALREKTAVTLHHEDFDEYGGGHAVSLFDVDAVDALDADDVSGQLRLVRTAVDLRKHRRREQAEVAGRRLRMKTTWSVLVAVVVAATLAGIVFLTPVLHVRHVRVEGASGVQAEAVRQAAGVDSRKTLLQVNGGAIRQSLQMLPWVKHAEVDRRLPWTVVLRVATRTPVAVVAAPNGRFVLDGSGHVISVAAQGGPALPTIAAPASVPPPGGAWTDAAGVQALAVARVLPTALLPLVDKLQFGDGRLVLAMRGGPSAAFGEARDIPRKASVLLDVLQDLKARNVTVDHIDVSIPDAPAYQPAQQPPPTTAPQTTPGSKPRKTSGRTGPTTSTAPQAKGRPGARQG